MNETVRSCLEKLVYLNAREKGSVGHTAGFLNHLAKLYRPAPVFDLHPYSYGRQEY